MSQLRTPLEIVINLVHSSLIPVEALRRHALIACHHCLCPSTDETAVWASTCSPSFFVALTFPLSFFSAPARFQTFPVTVTMVLVRSLLVLTYLTVCSQPFLHVVLSFSGVLLRSLLVRMHVGPSGCKELLSPFFELITTHEHGQLHLLSCVHLPQTIAFASFLTTPTPHKHVPFFLCCGPKVHVSRHLWR